MANKKISQLTAKAAGLAATDLIEISESDGVGGYVSKSVTGTNVLSSKQDTLVSGTNIKTINSTSILGSGNLAVSTTPSGVAGAIQFSDGSAFSSDATNLSFDDANNRLGVGQSTPTARVHIKGAGATNATTSLLVHNSSNVASLQCTDDLSVFSHGKGAVNTNTVYGKGAMLGATVTGTANTIIGVVAAAALSSGSNNVCIGWQAGFNITSGGGNVLIGQNAATTLTTNSNNIVIGKEAIATGSTNTVIGVSASSATFTGCIVLGSGATATASNQCVFGSLTTVAGAVAAEVNTSANVWNVIINGVARKILLA